MPDDNSTDIKTALKHLAWAAVPAAIAALAVLIQILQPYVPASHQSLLFNTALFVGNCTLATWLWCNIVRSHRRDRFADKRERDILTVVERIDRSLQAVHRKLDGQAEEIRHLRKLLLAEDSYRPGIGPTPYS